MGTQHHRSRICYWINEHDRPSIVDAASSKHPIEGSSEEIVDKIHGIVMEDRHIKLSGIVEMVCFSYEEAHNILHKNEKLQTINKRERAFQNRIWKSCSGI